MSQLLNRNKKMKIEHTTYEQCRGPGRSVPRPSISTQEKEKYLPPRKYSEQQVLRSSRRDEKGVTLWPRPNLPSPLETPRQKTADMMQQRENKKAIVARNEKKPKALSTSKSHMNCLPLRRSSDKRIGTDAAKTERTIRRIPKVERLRSPRLAEEKKPHNEPDMKKIYTVRDAIRAGKLERVVPPHRDRGWEERLDPPQQHRPLVNLATVKTPPPRRLSFGNPSRPRTKSSDSKKFSLDIPRLPKSPQRSSEHKTDSSGSSKIGYFIEGSVDILDEIVGKFSAPFEHISFSRRRKSPDEDSDVSFFCVGEAELIQASQGPQKKLPQPPSRSPSQGLSGKGTDTWTHPRPATCRLCREPGVKGIRGLCDQCEREFVRPATRHFGSDHEIKPTPPPKDGFVLPLRQSEIKRKPVTPPSGGESRGERKVALRMASVDHQPRVVIPTSTPSHKQSQEGLIEGGDDEEERWRKWQTPAMRAAYEKSREMYEKWSDYCERDVMDSWERDDREGQRKGQKKERNTHFYEFYDEVLMDHGV